MYLHVLCCVAAGDAAPELSPRYTVDENGVLTYEYDPAYIARKYEVFDLRIYHRCGQDHCLLCSLLVTNSLLWV